MKICTGSLIVFLILFSPLIIFAQETGYDTPNAAIENNVPKQKTDPRWNISYTKAREIINRINPGRRLIPDSWPNGKKIAVALTFDFDAELVWMYNPDKVSASKLSRGRYGEQTGLNRILNILNKRNIPATFFMPALIMKLYPESVNAIRSNPKHEIGYHGYAHENISSLSAEQERETLHRGLNIFKEKGIHPKVFRSPSWDFSPNTLKLLKEFDFKYNSSLMADDAPYEIFEDSISTGIIEFPVDWSLDDWAYFQLEWEVPMQGLRTPSEVFEIWKEEFEGIRTEGGLFVLTMHPQVIGRWNRIRMLDKLLDHIDSCGDVWYCTLSQAGDYLKEYFKMK